MHTVHHGALSHGWTYYQSMHVTTTTPCPVTHLHSPLKSGLCDFLIVLEAKHMAIHPCHF